MASYSESTISDLAGAEVKRETIGVLVEQIARQLLDLKEFTRDVLRTKLAPVTTPRPPKPEDDLKYPATQQTQLNVLGLLREVSHVIGEHRRELTDIVEQLDL